MKKKQGGSRTSIERLGSRAWPRLVIVGLIRKRQESIAANGSSKSESEFSTQDCFFICAFVDILRSRSVWSSSDASVSVSSHQRRGWLSSKARHSPVDIAGRGDCSRTAHLASVLVHKSEKGYKSRPIRSVLMIEKKPLGKPYEKSQSFVQAQHTINTAHG